MADLIDRNKIDLSYDEIVKCNHDARKLFNALVNKIESLPTVEEIDLVEVVRCKDCVFGRTGEGVGAGKWNIDCFNPNISKYRLPNDYCSYGERKEE